MIGLIFLIAVLAVFFWVIWDPPSELAPGERAPERHVHPPHHGPFGF